ncbi:uncharacterized protein [Mytilus edulis]|uniref:uncharacterized protein n=1 Tax=Mytilus edulis TaxID=6550 RepID=UPI0039EF19D6
MKSVLLIVTILCMLSVNPCKSQLSLAGVDIAGLLSNLTIEQKAGFLISFIANPPLFDKLENVFIAGYELFHEEPTFEPDILTNLIQWTLDELPFLLQNQTFKDSLHIIVEEMNKANLTILNVTNEFTIMNGIFAQMDWFSIIGKIGAKIVQPWLIKHAVDKNIVKAVIPTILQEGEVLIKTYLPSLLPGLIREFNKFEAGSTAVTPTLVASNTTLTIELPLITFLHANTTSRNDTKMLLFHYITNHSAMFPKLERLLLSAVPLLSEPPTIRDQILPVLLTWGLGTIPKLLHSEMFKKSFHYFVTKINQANVTGLNISNEYEFMNGVFSQIDWWDVIGKIASEFAVPLSTSVGMHPSVSASIIPQLINELTDLLKQNGGKLAQALIEEMNKADIAKLERVNYTSSFILNFLQNLALQDVLPDMLSKPTWKALVSATVKILPVQQKLSVVTWFLSHNVQLFVQLEDILLSALPILVPISHLKPEIRQHLVPWALEHIPDFLDSKLVQKAVDIMVSEVNSVNTSTFNQTNDDMYINELLSGLDTVRLIRRIATEVALPLSMQSGLKPEVATYMIPAVMQILEQVTKTDLANGLKILITEMNNVNLTDLDVRDPKSFVQGYVGKLNMRNILAGILAQPHISGFLVSTLLKSPQIVLDIGKILFSSFSLSDILSLPADATLTSTQKCYTGFIGFIENLLHGNKSAIKMFDAFGKPPTGTLDGNLHFIGSYDECLGVSQMPSSPVTRYCRATFKLPETLINQTMGHIETFGIPVALTWGMCLDSQCHSEDIPVLFRLGMLQMFNLTPDSVVCSGEKPDFSTDTPAISILAIMVVIVGIVVLATVFNECYGKLSGKSEEKRNSKNIYTNPSFLGENGTALNLMPGELKNGSFKRSLEKNEQKHDVSDIDDDEVGILSRILGSFSITSNVRTLASFDRDPDEISCLYGIRFLTALWICIGNAYLYNAIWPRVAGSDGSVISNQMPAVSLLKRFTFQFVFSGVFATDTFLVISGFIVTTKLLSTMVRDEKMKITGILGFYARRYIRLTPVYIIILMSYAFLYAYIGDGPTWPKQIGLADSCRQRWWYHLLYVNNLVDVDGHTIFQQCMPWSWFNAVVMQLNIITPILIILFLISHRLGFIVAILLMTGGITATGVKEHRYGGDLLSAVTDQGNYWNYIFTAPWCRVGTYCVGVMLAYVMFIKRRAKLDVLVAVIGWIVSILLGVFILFVSYLKYMENAPTWTFPEQAAYESLSHLAWACCIAWVIYSCHHYRGGMINTMLSWRGFIPLSKLSYTIYLLNPVVIAVYIMSRKSLLYVDDLDMAFLIVGYFVVTIIGASVMSVFFERPFIALEKAFSRSSNAKSELGKDV